MTNAVHPQLTVRIEPSEMVRYVQNLMAKPRSTSAADSSMAVARRHWDDPATAAAAHLRWSALSRAFGDRRISSWTSVQSPDQIHVPAALIAAAGVARLTVADDAVVFDIPTLLDATLELCEPVGHA